MSNGSPDKPIRSDRVKPEPIAWLWPIEANQAEDADGFRPGRIARGMLTTIAGRPGEGKSTLTAFFAAEVSKRHGDRNGVLFSNMEDDLSRVLRPRLDSAGANLTRVHFHNFFLHSKEDALAADIAALEKLIYAYNVGLLIADPIAAHMQPSLYNDQEVRRVLSPLTKMLSRTGCAMLAIAHTNKHVSKNAHPLSAIGGSGGGLAGASRAVYIFGKDPDDETVRVLAPAKFNIGPLIASVAFDMDDEEWVIGEGKDAKVIRSGKLSHLSDEHATDAIGILAARPGEGSEGPPAEKKAIAAEWLEGMLVAAMEATGDPTIPAKDLRDEASQVGISWATLRRAGDDVGVLKPRAGHGIGKGRGFTVWMLPDNHPTVIAWKAKNPNGVQTPAQAPTDDKTTDADKLADEGTGETDMSGFQAMLDATDDNDNPTEES